MATLGLMRRDARGNKILSRAGWFYLGLGAFLLTGAITGGLALYRERTAFAPAAAVAAAATPAATETDAGMTRYTTAQPAAIAPTAAAWTVSPYRTADGRDAYMVDDPQVFAAAKAAALETYLYTLFVDGLPDAEQLQSDLAQFTEPGAARRDIQALVAEYVTAGSYWRSASPHEVVFLDDFAAFSPDGQEALVPFLIQAGALQREQVDLSNGAVLRTESPDTFVIEARLRWDDDRSRWLLVEQYLGAVETTP